MRRDVRVFLDDIVEACGKINRYTSEFSLERFRQDGRVLNSAFAGNGVSFHLGGTDRTTDHGMGMGNAHL